MRRFVRLLRFAPPLLLLFACAPMHRAVYAAEYDIDPAHSFIQFRIQHLGFSWLIGRFNEFGGDFSYDPPAGEAGQRVSVVIETASIDSNHAERDKHLRGEKYLDVKQHPRASFTSTKFVGGENNEGVMHGDFTFRGVTKPLAIAVKKIGEGKDPWGGYRAGFEGRVKIYRSDYGMDAYLGPDSNEMELELYLEGVRR
jgi:polyisoprenoid-binding protein YceI